MERVTSTNGTTVPTSGTVGTYRTPFCTVPVSWSKEAKPSGKNGYQNRPCQEAYRYRNGNVYKSNSMI